MDGFQSVRIRLVFLFVESAIRKLTKEVQEQQRLAEALGCLHQLQPVFLQVSPGKEYTLSKSCCLTMRMVVRSLDWS